MAPLEYLGTLRTMTTNPSSFRKNWFVSTRWSVVIRAGRDSDPNQKIAATQFLCESYWQPLYCYIRRRGYSAEDAQDLTQEFFARLLEKDRLAAARQERGKFRSFLLTSLKHFLADERDKLHAKKRGGGLPILSLEFSDGERTYLTEPVDHVTPEQIFERRWALTLLENVIQQLKAEYEASGRAKLYSALHHCLLGERTALPYADLADGFGVAENTLKSLVHRLKRRYRTLLRQEIASTVLTPEEVDEELNYLFQILRRT